jgi:hypothetical protein
MPAFASRLARHRFWVLAAAVLLGVVASGGLRPAPAVITEALGAPIEIRIAQNAAEPKAADEDAADEPVEKSKGKNRKKGASVGVTVDDDTGRVRIIGAGGAREFDSFEQFVDQAPWIAGLIFAVTFLVFLTPILIIALVIWYKMRKTRMMNETMIRLAEKGVVPTAEAFSAVTGGSSNVLQSAPSAAPLYVQAKEARRKAVWSDLRKGFIIGAVGLGFTFYSMLDDGSPNFVGLILLFVGLAYIVLWYFEDRQVEAQLPPPPPPPAA